MKKIFLVPLLANLVFILFSCQTDNDFMENEEKGNANLTYSGKGSIEVLNNRLHFTNANDFTEVLKQYIIEKDDDIEENWNFIKDFYDDSFYSLIPPGIENVNEDEIKTQYEERLSFTKSDNRFRNLTDAQILNRIDQTRDIIWVDFFGAILNTEGEVQVEDKILKFTDTGIYSVEQKNYNSLLNYLSSNNLSSNFLIHTDDDIVRAVANYQFPINNDFINRLHVPKVPDPFPGGEGGGGGSWGPPPSNPSNQDPLTGLDEFLAGKGECDSYNSFLGSILGRYKVCTDTYGRRRVRTEAYNLSISFFGEDFYTAGIKNKNQRRKLWGLAWFNSKADLVAVGVEKFQLTYDYSSLLYPSQYIGSVNPQFVRYSYKPGNISYSVNTNFWYGNGIPSYTLLSTNSYPSYPTVFHDGVTIETIGNNLIGSLLDQGNEALAADKLNDYFWDFAYDTTKSHLQSLGSSSNNQNPDKISLIANYPNQGIVIVHKSYYKHCSNCKTKNKNFAIGGAGGFTVGFNGSNGSFSYETGAAGTSTITPENMRVRMYGVVKEGGTWHGNIMNYNFD